MSAVLESLPASPVAAARAALDAAQSDLAQLDARIRAYQVEQEEIEEQRLRHRTAVITAVGAGEPVPKPLKVKPTDAETALPILRGKRKEILERVADAEGKVRWAQADYIVESYRCELDMLADDAERFVARWSRVVGLKGLLDQAGVSRNVPPLPDAFTSDFAFPAFARLRPLAPNHWAFFLASHSIELNAGRSAMWAARAEIERELGMALPW